MFKKITDIDFIEKFQYYTQYICLGTKYYPLSMGHMYNCDHHDQTVVAKMATDKINTLY